MTWMTERNSSRDLPTSNLTAILQRKADSMSYSNKYYGHKEGRNDMDDSEEFMRGSSDIKCESHITVGSRSDVLQ